MKFALVLAGAWTLTMLVAYLHVRSNKKFPVTYFSNGLYRIDTSPALSWSKTKSQAIILGFIFYFLMIAMCIVSIKVATTYWFILAPEALSITFFVSGYSSRLVNNYVTVNKSDFEAWVNAGKIKQDSINHYVDVEGDYLLHLFDNKSWIK